MVWEPEVEELRKRTELAAQMGGEERIARQHGEGRLTVRERIDRLADDGSFTEIGAIAGRPTYEGDELVDLSPSNQIIGTARIDGRRVVVYGDDFTVRGGAADAVIGGKQVYAEKMAREHRIPIVRLIDGTGGGGSVRTYETTRRTYVPANPGWDVVVQNMAIVPCVSACLGPVAGLGAARVVMSHFSVMVKESSQLFVAGPPVVKAGMNQDLSKEELGGWRIHTTQSGAVDNAAVSDEDALEQCRRFLSYLPPSVWQVPPVRRCDDPPSRREEALLSAVPRSRRQVYDMRGIIAAALDDGSVFEMGRGYGGSVITALATLKGRPVGVLANDPRVYAGGISAAAANKMMRFCDLADTFHLPVVNFVDNPGFVIGVDAERAGTIRHGARALAAVYQAQVPWVSVIVRKAFGVAGAGHGNAQGLNFRVAWPSGDWGSLPLEGGIEAAYRRDLEASDDPEAMRADLLEKMEAMRSPFRTAEIFGIERMIDPRDTRPFLCDWVDVAYDIVPTLTGPTARGLRP